MKTNGPANGQARPYHHGDLRRVLLDEAAQAIIDEGTAALSLRGLARRIGVSHAAPAHHFGDKAGLLTALATEGFQRLATELHDTYKRTGSFLEVGVAYVLFALHNRAHFEVMFRPDLYHDDDPGLIVAKQAARDMLYAPLERLAGATSEFDSVRGGVAAWSLVHGFATLYINGSLPPQLGDDPESIARSVATYLFHPLPPGDSEQH